METFKNIWPIDETLTYTSTLGPNKPRSNGNEEILSTSKILRTCDSPSDEV